MCRKKVNHIFVCLKPSIILKLCKEGRGGGGGGRGGKIKEAGLSLFKHFRLLLAPLVTKLTIKAKTVSKFRCCSDLKTDTLFTQPRLQPKYINLKKTRKSSQKTPRLLNKHHKIDKLVKKC